MNSKFQEIEKKINEAKDIILTAHINPDGDAVGAGLALYIALKNKYKNKKILFLLQDEIPYTTKFLKYSQEIEKFSEDKVYNPDLLIFLDSATRERTGLVGENIKAVETINIDHHISNPEYANINCVIRNSSSTSEIIYNFLKHNNYEISLEIGEAIYLGLVNDTGNFSHSNVSKETMNIAASLINIGVNNNYIISNFLNSNSYQTLKLLGEALTNFQFFQNTKLSYFYLSNDVMDKYGAKKEDTEGIVEKILSYKDAEISLFLRQEKDGKIKGSMRSKKDIDVNKIAAIFSGGGHIKAAGFSSDLSENEILDIILNYLEKEYKK